MAILLRELIECSLTVYNRTNIAQKIVYFIK